MGKLPISSEKAIGILPFEGSKPETKASDHSLGLTLLETSSFKSTEEGRRVIGMN